MKAKYNYSIYTPQEIAREMVKKALEEYFQGEKTHYKLNKIRLGDLSCGNGNLLLTALEELLKISKELSGEYFFLKEWITGFDINIDAVKLTKVKGRELLKKYGLTGELDIRCEDSLKVENLEFNILLGNPPYLGEKNNKKIFQEVRETEFGKKYYEGKMDYFYFFIEKGIELLLEKGIMVYLTTNYWLRADGGKKLRDSIAKNGSFTEIVNYDNSLFSKATGQHNMIFVWKKSKYSSLKIKVITPDKEFESENSLIYDEQGKIVLADNETLEFNKKIIDNSNYILDDIVNINQGIVSGLDEAFVFDEYKEKFARWLKPFYKNKDVGKYTVSSKNEYWILYLDGKKEPDERVIQHLEKYKERLSKRREVVKGTKKWWELQWSRDEDIFSGPKILGRQRCKTNQFAYDEGEFFGSADIYFMTEKRDDISLYYVLGYINSQVFLQWFKYNGKIKGKNFEFYSTPLKETPIYYPDSIAEVKYIEFLVREQIKKFSEEREKEINSFFVKKLLM